MEEVPSQANSKGGNSLISGALLVAGILFFYFPSLLYVTNHEFIESSFRFISLLLVLFYLLFATVLWLIGLLLKPPARRIYSRILTAASFLLWCIGSFLVSQRGLLDGRTLLKAD